MKHLRTNRTLLRAFQESDLQILVEMMSDEAVMKFTGFKEPQAPEKVANLLQKWIKERSSTLGVWAAVDISKNDFVGWFMLKETGSKDPEIGFMLPKCRWGQGFATEISSAILNYAFGKLGMRRVIATTHRNNAPSIKVLEKIGMRVVSDESASEEILQFEKVLM
jgi:RimJ/RimL family protein N-acetyltransferase